MSKEKEQEKLESTLRDAATDIAQLKHLFNEKTEQLPQSITWLEQRIKSLESDLDTTSDKMLAYKLQRIVGSKMLASVGEAEEIDAARPKGFESSTFQCKTDLDTCLCDAQNTFGKALCYLLFIRCVVKG